MITEWQEEMDGLARLWTEHTVRHDCLDRECPVRVAIVQARVTIDLYRVRREGNKSLHGTVAVDGRKEKMMGELTSLNSLDSNREFAGEILYAPNTHLDALTLAIAASHTLKTFQTVPRLLFTSPAGQSGKSTALDVIRLLGQAPWLSTGATSYALRSRFNEPDPPFIIADEISTIFGASGLRGGSNPIGLIARDGYRRTATLSLSADRTAVDISTFCFLAMAGLKTAVPADIRTRCIVFPMTPVPRSIRLPRASTDPDTEQEAINYRLSLHNYVGMLTPLIREIQRSFVPPHPLFRDRKDQIWRPLMLVAMASDAYEAQRREELGLPPRQSPGWTQRCLSAFKALALDASDLPALLPSQMMLRDVAAIFRETGEEKMFAKEILALLRDSGEEMWDTLTSRRMENLMTEALGPSDTFTVNGRRARGFRAAPVLRSWENLEAMLLPPALEVVDEGPSLFDDLDPVPARKSRTSQSLEGIAA